MSIDAVEFLKQYNRMVESGVQPFAIPAYGLTCEDIVNCVERWASEHPAKTRQSEFLKMFPNVMRNNEGQPCICPRTLDTVYQPDGDCALDVDICQRCRAKFWGQEVE